MTSEKSPGTDYRTRQIRVGDALRRETRSRLLEAAESEFSTHSYAGTTVTRLATTAGVSVQTLYLAWGSKRELLRGYLEVALAGGEASPADTAARFTGLPPRERLAMLADVVAEIAERAATGWSLYRDAAAVDPEIAADWSELQRLRHELVTTILTDVPITSLAAGLTRARAIDTAWTIASPESYDLLTHHLDYDLDRFHEWLKRTLASALLTPREISARSGQNP